MRPMQLQSSLTPAIEHTFVTSQGRPYTIFRRALDANSLISALAAAHDLHYVSLPDALRLIVLMARDRDKLLARSVVRWLGRFCLETSATLDEILDAAEHLAAIVDGIRPAEQVAALDQLCAQHKLSGALERMRGPQQADVRG
jgi:hypothetical protein